jgi:heat shock protein HslJ
MPAAIRRGQPVARRISMRKLCKFASVVFVASLAIGCSQSASAPTSPSGVGGSATLTADQFAGTWTLVSIHPFGQTERATPPNASYTLTFADGRVSTRADCNSCGGTFALSGGTLTVGPALACTKAACPTMEFESVYTSLLSGDSTVTLSDRILLLSSGRGSLRFSR